MDKFHKAVKSAIAITEDKDFSEKNSEIIKNTLAGVAKRFEEFQKSMTETLRPMIQFSEQYSEMMAPLSESIIKIFSIMQEAIRPTIQSNESEDDSNI
jgi:hypothetical protein